MDFLKNVSNSSFFSFFRKKTTLSLKVQNSISEISKKEVSQFFLDFFESWKREKIKKYLSRENVKCFFPKWTKKNIFLFLKFWEIKSFKKRIFQNLFVFHLRFFSKEVC